MKRKSAFVILITLTAVLAVWVVKSAVHISHLWKMKQYREKLLIEKKALEIDNNRLKTILKEMDETDELRERLIYMKLGLKKPGDVIIKIQNSK